MTLIAIAVLSGCASAPNPTLNEAHSSYNNARNDAEIVNLAPLELKDASDTLGRADAAFGENEETGTVTNLAYVAKQQVEIAKQTAKRKTAEQAVTSSAASRTAVQLDARTAEADAAKKQIALLKEMNAQKTERGMVITLGDVLFSTDRAELKPGGVRNVQKLADFLKEYPEYKVSVEGHTDSRGTDEHNQDLSERRAYAVQTELMAMAVGSDRVVARGYGEGFPVASNENSGGQQLNRRVEIILSDENGNISPR
ncbi:MAG: OmpA family protein [Methylococcales bacterium]|nr:OmpA family protein [Methylococcales bacterium]